MVTRPPVEHDGRDRSQPAAELHTMCSQYLIDGYVSFQPLRVEHQQQAVVRSGKTFESMRDVMRTFLANRTRPPFPGRAPMIDINDLVFDVAHRHTELQHILYAAIEPHPDGPFARVPKEIRMARALDLIRFFQFEVFDQRRVGLDLDGKLNIYPVNESILDDTRQALLMHEGDLFGIFRQAILSGNTEIFEHVAGLMLIHLNPEQFLYLVEAGFNSQTPSDHRYDRIRDFNPLVVAVGSGSLDMVRKVFDFYERQVPEFFKEREIDIKRNLFLEKLSVPDNALAIMGTAVLRGDPEMVEFLVDHLMGHKEPAARELLRLQMLETSVLKNAEQVVKETDTKLRSDPTDTETQKALEKAVRVFDMLREPTEIARIELNNTANQSAIQKMKERYEAALGVSGISRWADGALKAEAQAHVSRLVEAIASHNPDEIDNAIQMMTGEEVTKLLMQSTRHGAALKIAMMTGDVQIFDRIAKEILIQYGPLELVEELTRPDSMGDSIINMVQAFGSLPMQEAVVDIIQNANRLASAEMQTTLVFADNAMGGSRSQQAMETIKQAAIGNSRIQAVAEALDQLRGYLSNVPEVQYPLQMLSNALANLQNEDAEIRKLAEEERGRIREFQMHKTPEQEALKALQRAEAGFQMADKVSHEIGGELVVALVTAGVFSPSQSSNPGQASPLHAIVEEYMAREMAYIPEERVSGALSPGVLDRQGFLEALARRTIETTSKDKARPGAEAISTVGICLEFAQEAYAAAEQARRLMLEEGRKAHAVLEHAAGYGKCAEAVIQAAQSGDCREWLGKAMATQDEQGRIAVHQELGPDRNKLPLVFREVMEIVEQEAAKYNLPVGAGGDGGKRERTGP